jgi:hypothetical protein
VSQDEKELLHARYWESLLNDAECPDLERNARVFLQHDQWWNAFIVDNFPTFSP